MNPQRSMENLTGFIMGIFICLRPKRNHLFGQSAYLNGWIGSKLMSNGGQ